MIELPGGGWESSPQVAVAPSGQATVAWWHYDAGSTGRSMRVGVLGDSGFAGTVRDIPIRGSEFVVDEHGNITVTSFDRA